MPASYIIPAKFPIGGIPKVEWMQTVATPPTFIKGAAVVANDGTGLIDECGVNPLLIAGFALSAAETAFGFQVANNPTTFTGREENVSVAIANDSTEFMARLTAGSNVTVAPTVANKFQQYGLVKQATGEWTVDSTIVGADARVIVTSIDADQNRVFFKVLAAYRQFNQ